MRFTPFQRLAIATTALTYLLIAVGGLVRASGAGLGCPDWPRCFGSWIPPASAAALPAGFDAAQFNSTLMWTEYLNRVLGVSVGFAILATTVSASRWHLQQARIFWPIVAALLLTGYQGWLGGRVVAHELAPWIVTAHMIVALVIVQLLLWATLESLVLPLGREAPRRPGVGAVAWTAGATTAVLLFQVALGTQVRGSVDRVLDVLPRADVLATVGAVDLAHRETAAVLTMMVVGLWMWVWIRHDEHTPLRWATSVALAVVVLQMAAGMVLAAAALPPAAQVVHLVGSAALLGALTTVCLVAARWPGPSAAAAGRAVA